MTPLKWYLYIQANKQKIYRVTTRILALNMGKVGWALWRQAVCFLDNLSCRWHFSASRDHDTASVGSIDGSSGDNPQCLTFSGLRCSLYPVTQSNVFNSVPIGRVLEPWANRD